MSQCRAIANEQAGAQLREFIQARLLEGMGTGPVDDPDAALRAGLASSMLVGLVVGRRLVGVPILTNPDVNHDHRPHRGLGFVV